MSDNLTHNTDFRESLRTIVDDVSQELNQMETEVIPKILVLKKSLTVLIDQSVSISRACIDKDFLDTFPDIDMKARVQTKIFNSLEGDTSKLNEFIDEHGMKLATYRSSMSRLEEATLNSHESQGESFLNLINAFEMARDCLHIYSHLFIKLQMAATSINYDNASSLSQLSQLSSEIRNAKKNFLEKRVAITEFLLPMNGEEIKLVSVGS